MSGLKLSYSAVRRCSEARWIVTDGDMSQLRPSSRSMAVEHGAVGVKNLALSEFLAVAARLLNAGGGCVAVQ